ncbi:MAG: hypothetical protein PWP40_2491 [Rhodocyclaceae bacterium]|nr:hypothetical protein [Rhodocyclaceae bacterium]
MAFKLVVFIAILVAVAVLGTRGYRASVRRFERERGGLAEGQDGGAG